MKKALPVLAVFVVLAVTSPAQAAARRDSSPEWFATKIVRIIRGIFHTLGDDVGLPKP